MKMYVGVPSMKSAHRSIQNLNIDWGPKLLEGGAGEIKWMRESLLLKLSTKTLDASRRDMYKNRPTTHDQGRAASEVGA